ncbi:MAG TPA: diaminopimelate decarboxylase [Syntrophorhabdaceae bacterium]|nr:diaminopimelate decarboxylase [Syntrophorhabdaceae bacterium]HOL04542.1 diaminopimelate decarboxylase [Syntrophorhabdaceae bacterium]HPP42226.1 diaminopimelate decarboxylase [Syntrophorhabdaceae bacterium]
MNFFHYKDNELYCEDLSVAEIVKKTGTPVYIYSYKTLKRHFEVFDGAFKGLPHIVCYSCKANSNISIIAVFGRLGGGADIVSGGELFRASMAGIPPERIVYSGVGKTKEEIKDAVKSDILMINIESEAELNVISRIAEQMKKEIRVSIRVNPEIDPKTHPYITTGLKKNKFGIIWEDALRLYKDMAKNKYLLPIGVSSHIGSQILELSPFIEAVRSLKDMVYQLRDMGIGIRYLDIGGGLGITYKDETAPHPEEYAEAIKNELKDTGLTLILEPGRVLVGNSGIFVAEVIYVKKVSEKTFIIVDGAMNDLIRPSLYGAYHEISPVHRRHSKKIKVDVVGPICESGDFFAKDRVLPQLKEGELIAIHGAGAYGFSMSSNYNSRRRATEVLVSDDRYFIIRKRETKKDLIKGESIPEFLRV